MSIVFIIAAIVGIPFLVGGAIFEKVVPKWDKWINNDTLPRNKIEE